MPDSLRGSGERKVECFDHYRDAALLLRLLGEFAPAHAAKHQEKCEGTGDQAGAARWRAIRAAMIRLRR